MFSFTVWFCDFSTSAIGLAQDELLRTDLSRALLAVPDDLRDRTGRSPQKIVLQQLRDAGNLSARTRKWLAHSNIEVFWGDYGAPRPAALRGGHIAIVTCPDGESWSISFPNGQVQRPAMRKN